MAQSYVILTLDTTAPDVEVLMPNYTTMQARTEIRVVANELLAEWQEIYVIDSLDNRHDLNFRHEEKELVGIVVFEEYPLGISTVHARVMDEVGNKSSIAKKSIRILDAESLTVSLSESINDVSVSIENYQNVTVEDEMINEVTLYDNTTNQVSTEDDVLNKVVIEDNVSNEVSLSDENKHIIRVNSEEVEHG